MNKKTQTENANSRQKAQQNSPQKPGFAARRTAVTLLSKVIDDHHLLDQLTSAETGLVHFRNLDQRDQVLAKTIAQTTMRHYRRIGVILSQIYDRKPPKRARSLVHTIETAAAQILFMDIPDSAAVNLAVAIIRADRRTTRFAGFANAVLRKLEREKITLLEKSAGTHPFPGWLFKKLASGHGKEKMLESGKMLAEWPYLGLTLKTPGNNPSNIKCVELPPGSVRVLQNTPVTEIPGYDEGEWWVQDISASLPVKLMGNVKDKKVADLCAAPGGKTLQLASLGANVTAVDISPKRIGRLRQNLQRTKLEAETVQADIAEWDPPGMYDAVLLDAPCTATGTARRHPDVLWNRTPDDVETLVALQRRLIEKSASLLRPGGVLVYANCSMLKEEGENLVATLEIDGLVLDRIAGDEVSGLEFCINGQGTLRCLPHFLQFQNSALPMAMGGMDGFFIARFKRV